jgi:hypothetical protein
MRCRIGSSVYGGRPALKRRISVSRSSLGVEAKLASSVAGKGRVFMNLTLLGLEIAY